MNRMRTLLVQGSALVALGALQTFTARSSEAATPSAAYCELCYDYGCPMVLERVAMCAAICEISDSLPTCNYWGPCSDTTDGHIICFGAPIE